jgi:hypothetical protein
VNDDLVDTPTKQHVNEHNSDHERPARRGSEASPHWRIFPVSVAGLKHVTRDTPSEDAVAFGECFTGGFVLTAADGAGSARCAAAGSQIATATITKSMLTMTADRLTPAQWPGTFNELLNVVREALERDAERTEMPVRAYATTLLVCVFAEGYAFCGQVGDGNIVLRRNGDYFCPTNVASPEHESETYFVTDPIETLHKNLSVTSEPIDDIDAGALFTDGLVPVAMNRSIGVPHKGFFDPIFRRGRDPVESGTLIDSLHDLFSSPRMIDRTDDDVSAVFCVSVP